MCSNRLSIYIYTKYIACIHKSSIYKSSICKMCSKRRTLDKRLFFSEKKCINNMCSNRRTLDVWRHICVLYEDTYVVLFIIYM